MNDIEWDKDVERGLEKLRLVDEEIKQHVYYLWCLSDGKIGKRPPYKPDISTNLMSGKVEGKK